MQGTNVRVEQEGRVMTVRLDNPPHNFMTGEMVVELERLIDSLEDDRSVGAVILTGAPEDIFITHFDIAEIAAGVEAAGMSVSPAVARGSLRAVGAVARIPGAERALARSPAAGLADLLRMHEVFNRMGRMDKVFIAAINGRALGGGCELALACDIRLMAAGEHRIGCPEMSVGIIPGGGGTQRLTRALGTGRALEAMLEARTFTPPEAAEIGLIHRVVPAPELAADARATAERMSRRSPASVSALKRAVYEGGSLPLESGLHRERALFLSVSGAPAVRRALAAYVDGLETGVGPAWADESALAPWREGTIVDLTE